MPGVRLPILVLVGLAVLGAALFLLSGCAPTYAKVGDCRIARGSLIRHGPYWIRCLDTAGNRLEVRVDDLPLSKNAGVVTIAGAAAAGPAGAAAGAFVEAAGVLAGTLQDEPEEREQPWELEEEEEDDHFWPRTTREPHEE